MGRLRPGDPLPPVRVLARELRVSPGTVANAFGSLRTRGIVVTDGRRGTRVGRRPPISPGPSRFARRAIPPGVVDLANGSPDPSLLPNLGPALTRQSREKRMYGEVAVEPALAAAGGAWLGADGIDVSAMTVVSGAMDGVERVLTAWLAPGDRVLVEDPGYAAVLDLVAALGLESVPVPVDDEGLSVDAFARSLRRGVSAVILTPRAQNPTGAALSPTRADALRDALESHPDVIVIEDDHAGPVAGADAVTVVGAGGWQRWALVRSVAKSLGPDLRCALVAGDPATVARVEGRLSLGPGWVSGLLQGTVADLLGGRRSASLLSRAARTYASRRHALVDDLLDLGINAHGRSGLNVWVPVVDEAAVVAQMLASGFAIAGGSRYRVASPPAIRITTASLAVADSPRVAEAVAQAVASSPTRVG